MVSEFAFADGVVAPRKQPTQDRSKHTVAAILEATIRVLDEVGSDALKTTRVADVAGVSVGTLYQYFPNRDALLNAVLADHLDAAIGALVQACDAAMGEPLPVALEKGIRAFLRVKAERVDTTRIMNQAFGTGMLDERPVVRAAVERAYDAVARLLAQTHGPDAARVRARIGCDAVEGMVRGALPTPETLRDPAWVDQVVRIGVAALA